MVNWFKIRDIYAYIINFDNVDIRSVYHWYLFTENEFLNEISYKQFRTEVEKLKGKGRLSQEWESARKIGKTETQKLQLL